ncbi:hypothetical protein SLEP1_g39494 [Rubroshorea leprosula]|uniref:Uncharacterized protein n=1 Tax=Rubroshorea leprosula TaxID=152421 RepID=A0AAV5L0M9_9ROSI|nr:hypothetical protein SLEP1_g39494 [Rubroshorea leprosula]
MHARETLSSKMEQGRSQQQPCISFVPVEGYLSCISCLRLAAVATMVSCALAS